ncbi:hypothetical protein [Nocardia sp. NPDC060249]|uniref:hypothetical protein n=1 Tax=Nocardia sp. NPDC060249 TaxID=3347082 RepID=UPI0036575438
MGASIRAGVDPRAGLVASFTRAVTIAFPAGAGADHGDPVASTRGGLRIRAKLCVVEQ